MHDQTIILVVLKKNVAHTEANSDDPSAARNLQNQFRNIRTEETMRQRNERKKVISRTKSQSICYQCKICLQPFSLLRYLRKHLTISSAEKPNKCQEYYKKTNPDNIWDANLYITVSQCKPNSSSQDVSKSQGDLNSRKYVSNDLPVEEIWIISDDEHDVPKETDRQQNTPSDANNSEISSEILDQPNPQNISGNRGQLVLEDRPQELMDTTNNDEQPFNQTGARTTNGERIGHSLHTIGHNKLPDNISRTCNTCNKTFSTSCGYRQHMLIVHQPSRFQCEICQKKFKEMSKLRRHKLAIHEGVRYKCELCPKKFTQTTNLKNHKLTIHAGVCFKCDLCEKKFQTLLGLNLHKSTAHYGTRYKCDLCPKEFPHLQTLKSHKLNVHEGVRFKCDVCQNTYSTSKNFRRHQLAGGVGKCTSPAQKIYYRDN